MLRKEWDYQDVEAGQTHEALVRVVAIVSGGSRKSRSDRRYRCI
jgi:hypothetical protein